MNEGAPSGSSVAKEHKNAAVVVWALSFVGLIVPLGSILGPLVFWLLKKDESAYVNSHGKSVLNFNISVLLYSFIILFIAMLPYVGVVAMPLFILLAALWLFGVIKGCLSASNGRDYTPPLSLQLLK
jgi:uncharacterized Tic20 family protein